jgi:hypothetical protein
MNNVTPGIALPCHAPDCQRSDAANRWVLRELRRYATRPAPQFVPPLALVELPERAWTRPAPRRSQSGRELAVTYHRTRRAIRAVCRYLPFLAPIARRVF